MSMELKELINRAKALPPEERALLRRELQELDPSAVENPPDESDEDRFMQRLVDLGLLESARHPARDEQRFRNYQMPDYDGPPVSELINEERR